MDLIVKHTNEKIEADFIEKAYSEETLQKSPYINYTDEVGFFPFWYKFSKFSNIFFLIIVLFLLKGLGDNNFLWCNWYLVSKNM